MSSVLKSSKRFVVALNLTGKSVPQIIAEAQGIVQGMAGNAWFPSPPVVLSTVSAAIAALVSSQTAAQTKARGTSATMHGDLRKLEPMLHNLASYVQGIANDSPLSGDAIITAANMHNRKPAVNPNKGYRVHATKKAGELFIMTRRVKGASYNFEMTTDTTNAASWTSIYKGTKCKFIKTGLVSGTRYYIRVIATDVTGEAPPSNVLSAIVL